MPRSFAELEMDHGTTAKELVEVFREYVATGAAISARVVIALIDRTKPDSDNRVAMKEAAQKGFLDQNQRNFPTCAEQYKKVAQHLN